VSKAFRVVCFLMSSLAISFFIPLPDSSRAASFGSMEKLLPESSSGGAAFGQAVAIKGELAVIGAPGEAQGRGAAYLFEHSGSGWQLKARLSAAAGEETDFFGTSVAIGDGVVAIGAPKDDNEQGTDAGTVYLFVEPDEGWHDMTQTTILLPNDGAMEHTFGAALSFDRNMLAVGAPGPEKGNFEGAVYLFEGAETVWTQRAKLTASDGRNGDLFGYALDKVGEFLLVGAYGKGEGRGAAYLFRRPASGWTDSNEDELLEVHDGKPGERFGISVALAGTWAVVGADMEDSKGSGAGAIYLFSGPEWNGTKIVPSDGHPDQGFGYALDATGDRLAVGALLDDEHGEKAGAVYMYQRIFTGWKFQDKLFSPEGVAGDRFGSSVALTSDYLLAGAYSAGVDGRPDAGSAQLVSFAAAPGNEGKADVDGGTVDGSGGGALGSALLSVVGIWVCLIQRRLRKGQAVA